MVPNVLLFPDFAPLRFGVFIQTYISFLKEGLDGEEARPLTQQQQQQQTDTVKHIVADRKENIFKKFAM